MGIRWDDPTTTRVTIRSDLINRGGILSGVVAFTLIDYGMGSTLWPHITEEEMIATLGISITYLRAAREGDLVCTSALDRRTRSSAALRSDVVLEQTGELIATAIGTYSIFSARGRERSRRSP
jgi:acyl-coenzyme A thioesterase PaaI-like protein